MKVPSRTLLALLLLASLSCLAAPVAETPAAPPVPPGPDLLGSLVAEAADPWQKYREEMLVLINRDREENGLGPVALDRFASYFGQLHAEEMAKHDYLSHWALDGTKPYVRWSRLGGLDHLAENVGFHGVRGADIAKTFTMKKFEDGFMKSPGHRATILEKYHNRVGIGVALNSSAGSAYCVQEFIDHYVGLYAFTREVKGGQKTTLCGRVLDGAYGPFMVMITHEPVPPPMSVEALRESSSYPDYGDTKLPAVPPWVMKFDRKTGNFWIPLTFPKTPGLYYVVLFIRGDVDSIPYHPGGGARVTTDGAIPATSIVFEMK